MRINSSNGSNRLVVRIARTLSLALKSEMLQSCDNAANNDNPVMQDLFVIQRCGTQSCVWGGTMLRPIGRKTDLGLDVAR